VEVPLCPCLDRFPTKHLPGVSVRDVPEPPRSVWRVIGPGVVAAGVGLASGEFILWPYIASQVGLVFLWAAAIGIGTQWFINMEIERYTLATGETALTGFSGSGGTGAGVRDPRVLREPVAGLGDELRDVVTYLFGGNRPWIAAGMLVLIGITLTLAPVVYTALERVEFVKVGPCCCSSSWRWCSRSRAAPGASCRRRSTAPRFPTSWASR
jgi:hypothetical protein